MEVVKDEVGLAEREERLKNELKASELTRQRDVIAEELAILDGRIERLRDGRDLADKTRDARNEGLRASGLNEDTPQYLVEYRARLIDHSRRSLLGEKK